MIFRPIALLCIFAVALTGCSLWNDEPAPSSEPIPSPVPAPVAEDIAKAYLALWQNRDYAGMYALLTPQAREAMTEPQFAERYEKIYEGIEATNLVVTEVPPVAPSTEAPGGDEDLQGKSVVENVVRAFEYRVRMDTVAGAIEFSNKGVLRKMLEGEKMMWFVEWMPSSIFPGMEEGDKVRVQTVASERGEIVDRNGVGLAVNGSSPQLGIIPGRLGDDADNLKALIAKKLGISAKEIDRKLGASWVKPDLFVPIGLVPESEVADFEGIPAVSFQQKSLRSYPFGKVTAHLTGYVGEINAEELERTKDKGYKSGDLIGKTGLEQVLEDKLRGTDGVVVAIADESGERKSVLAEKAAVQGMSFQLTIDSELQTSIYNEVKEDAASVAAVEPATGEILALLSSPAYDPNAFSRGLSSEQFDAWNQDARKPFLNRFARGYAPGSSFKPITAAIGLDTKSLDPAEKKPIAGLKWTKDGSWGSYYVKRIHAVNPVDLSKALTYSDNIYFAQAAVGIGTKKFAEGAAKFGIGEEIPIVYPIAKSQLAKGNIESDILLADSGYGQGQVTMSSLHVALVYSSIANDGNIAYPKLILYDEATVPRTWKERAMSADTAALLKEDLVQAVASPAGVGHGASVPGASIAGKTGTAELKASKGAEGQENGWFVGFDANAPKFVLAIMIENVQDRGGSKYVTPKAKRIFEQAMKQR
ncbi:penicillin-binding transpeptidase domain-containing protein [Cohnella suwonensis]|uniref:Penicillin-binding transpeptidase domain-containing protein n=1 Tax=Cohnella suwonensis TaxID=696072 RepID=A0ABW0M2T1_9BACL